MLLWMMARHSVGIGAVLVAAWLLASAMASAQSVPRSSDPDLRGRQKEFLFNEAMLYVQQHDWDNAIRDLQEALGDSPDDEDLQQWLRRAKGERAKSWMIEDVRVEGDVVLVTPDGHQYPGPKMIHVALDNKARIMAAPASRLTMLLPDGTTFAIGGAADGGEIMLDGFVYQPDSDKLTYLIQIARGYLRYVTGDSTRPRLPPFAPNAPPPQGPGPGSPIGGLRAQYAPQIRTPVGALLLLGTDVECNISADGTGVITVNEGPVAFRAKGATAVRTLTAGQSIRFDGDRVVEIR